MDSGQFRIPVDDVKRAQQFYSDAFGWRLTAPEDVDEELEAEMIYEPDEETPEAEADRIGEMLPRRKHVSGADSTASVEVDSIETALARVEAAGGEVVIPKGETGDEGYGARFRDTEGNLVDLWERTKT